MIKKPIRSDTMYEEIEKFEPYELTQCVAYEMASRAMQNDTELNEIYNIKTNGLFESSSYLKKIEDKFWIHYENDNNLIASNVVFNNSFALATVNKILEMPFNELESKTFNFSRPRLRIPKQYNKSIALEINLNLPLPELEAYIKKLKENYDANKGIIKTPLELSGIDFEEADDKNRQKKPKSNVYADWFYIYDFWKFQKKEDISDEEIFIDIECINDDFYKQDNIRKIRDKMKYFIEDLGYKELITGVKIS